MDVFEGEDGGEVGFALLVESAMGGGFFGIVVGLEEDVPDGEVGVVLGVVLVLMVDAVGFGTLEPGAEPTRRADIPVVEVFRDGGKEGVERGGFDGDAEDGVGEGGGDQGVDGDLDGVLVEAGEDFDAPGGVVKLVAESPEEF